MRYKALEHLDHLDGNPDRARWYRCVDPNTKSNLLVKSWHDLPQDDTTLQLLWSRHVRQLQKFSVHRAARDYLLPIQDSWSDETGFHLAFFNNGRLPTRSKGGDQANRTRTWRNLYRLACAINALHNAGFIHRRIGLGSVFTNPDSTKADYQLGNFDWGIWLRDPGNSPGPSGTYSFNTDWADFSKLAVELLGLDWDKVANDYTSAGLTFEEFKVLRNLQGDPNLALPSLRSPVESLERICQSRAEAGNYYYIGFNSKSQQHLWGGSQPRDWLEADLTNPLLRRVTTKYGLQHQLVLLGRKHTYVLKPAGINSEVQTVDVVDPGKKFTGTSKRTSPNALRIIDLEMINANSLADVRPWWPEAEMGDDTVSSLQLNAFRSLLCCESIWQLATCTWLVRLTNSKKNAEKNYSHTIEVVRDEPRARLNKLLGLKSPEVELEQSLTDLRFAQSSEWQVRRWPFDNTESEDWSLEALPGGEPASGFVFTGRTRFEIGQQLELKSPAAHGNEPLGERKLGFLRYLEGWQPLLQLVHDPRSQGRRSESRTSPIDDSDLDESKRRAIRKIERAPALFAIQGPPGVGKSFLLLHLAKKTLADNPSARLLLTAHGQDTVNQFAETLQSNYSDLPDGLLIVRTRSSKEKSDGPFQLRGVLTALLRGVLSSSAFFNASKSLQDEVWAIPNAKGPERALESLVLASADIVLTTTTSREVEEAVKANALFDQVIIEEAGRATGTDLIGPLLLSHRRLLVGDSNQLPPFGERQLKQMLRTEEHFRQIIENDALAAGASSRSVLRKVLEDIDSHARSTQVRGIADATNLFDSVFKKGIGQATSPPTSASLTHQYRMHPRIAQIVSELFYNNRLESAEPLIKSREWRDRPFKLTGALTTVKSPLVFVNTPYVARRKGAGECAPPYWNEGECEAVVGVLRCLRSRSLDKPLSIAVLTPYNEQVRRLQRKLAKQVKHLGHSPEALVHTIDSFQGSEADVVVASLVRNNTHRYGKGLGILADARRMNVLISRAKWMLIIVGSSDFIKTRFPPFKPITATSELYFLKQLSKKIRNPNAFKRIDCAKLASTRGRRRR